MTSPSFDPAHDPFEQIYRSVGEHLEQVPWASLQPRVELVRWLDSQPAPTPGPPRPRALVVACGLGDDAEELTGRGFAVVAFDFSPTAIDICRRRFPDSEVTYEVRDLLDLPARWRRGFDLVVEVNTVQSLVPEQHHAGIRAIADTVATGGALFVRCSGRAETEPADHRPWPLTRRELNGFQAAGLVEQTFDESVSAKGDTQFIVTYQRPG